MLPCFCADSRSDPAACVSATQTEEGFHVIEVPLYRIETVRRFHVPGHTDYRDLNRYAKQRQSELYETSSSLPYWHTLKFCAMTAVRSMCLLRCRALVTV